MASSTVNVLIAVGLVLLLISALFGLSQFLKGNSDKAVKNFSDRTDVETPDLSSYQKPPFVEERMVEATEVGAG